MHFVFHMLLEHKCMWQSSVGPAPVTPHKVVGRLGVFYTSKLAYLHLCRQ